MAKMKEVMGSLDRDMVEKACRRFRSRLEAVVEAGGDFIE
jgi:phage tail protein X